MKRFATIWVGLLALGMLSACGGVDGPAGPDDGSESPRGAGDRTFPADEESAGKEDVFGRSLVGAPDPYPAATDLDESALESNMRRRRQVAWGAVRKVLEPVELLSLKNRAEKRPDCPDGVGADALKKCSDQSDAASCNGFSASGQDGICQWDESSGSCQRTCDRLTLSDGREVPEIPRWQTWYGVRDINRIFRTAYGQLDASGRIDRARIPDTQIGASFFANNTAVERSSRWPLWRYTNTVMDLFGCELQQKPDESDAAYRRRCAAARQSRFSGAAAAGNGIARVMYSPAAVLHTVRNYAQVLECRDQRFEQSWCTGDRPCEDPPENFSTCFRTEFPKTVGKPWGGSDGGRLSGLPDAGGTVLIKASWRRVGFGFELPAFDTSGQALEERIGEGGDALWGEEGNLRGDRSYGGSDDGEGREPPGPDEIYTIETRSGQRYRLTGLHIMTKELRHWMWITLWWSDRPDRDFGADRPENFDELAPAWSNYKMCTVVDYRESDPNVVERFEDHPTLQEALAATNPEPGKPTWCSNPYIEHGSGNARTNCIGCHQHAGTNYAEKTGDNLEKFDLEEVIANDSLELSPSNRYPANGRTRRRREFPTDYAWTFDRLDNLTELIRKEVEHRGAGTDAWSRRKQILEADGDPSAGEEIFRNASEEQTCTDCHRADGIGPDLEQRFAQRTEWQLLSTILGGRGRMPAWGDRLSDGELTDLMAFLRQEFAP